MLNETGTVYPWWFDAASIILRYFLIAGSAYAIFYVWKYRRFSHLKIQAKVPAPNAIRKEIFYSGLTLLIYCATSAAIFYFYETGNTKIYARVSERGYLYFWGSILLMIVLHDTYFYWTHRFMHLPWVFKRVHRTHHLSVNPTPWSSFAFHPLEAIISVGFIPLIVFTIPCHPYAVFIFLSFMTIINVMGHLGYETFSQRFRNSKIGQWQNTSTYHNIHHLRGHYNYGLYFTFWDRVMNTYLEKIRDRS